MESEKKKKQVEGGWKTLPSPSNRWGVESSYLMVTDWESMQNSILLRDYRYQTEELSSKLTFIKGREEFLIFYEGKQ